MCVDSCCPDCVHDQTLCGGNNFPIGLLYHATLRSILSCPRARRFFWRRGTRNTQFQTGCHCECVLVVVVVVVVVGRNVQARRHWFGLGSTIGPSFLLPSKQFQKLICELPATYPLSTISIYSSVAFECVPLLSWLSSKPNISRRNEYLHNWSKLRVSPSPHRISYSVAGTNNCTVAPRTIGGWTCNCSCWGPVLGARC